MPLFTYLAQDKEGRSVEGSVSADTLQAAQTTLVQRGLRVFEVRDKAAPRTAAVTAKPAPQTAPAQVAAPRPAAQAAPAGPQRVNMPAAKPTRTVYTKRGSDKVLTFLFSQLTSYFRTGVNPSQALQNLGSQQPRLDYRGAILEAAKETTEGVRFSHVLKRYPDLFPPHVWGMVEAGEEGGFLPDACQAIADQTERSRRLKVFCTFLYWCILINLAVMPASLAMIRGTLDLWDVEEKTGGSAPGAGTLAALIGKGLLWPVLPATIAGALIAWAGLAFFNARKRTLWRHKLVLKLPSLGKRASSESLALFAWTLGNVSNAGISPRTAFGLAIGAMPNLEMQRRMRLVYDQMQDNVKLSDALINTKTIPHEYGVIVQTGEITGDLGNSLMNVSNATKADFGNYDKMSMVRIGCWIGLVFALAALFGAYLVYGVYYPQIMHKVLGDN